MVYAIMKEFWICGNCRCEYDTEQEAQECCETEPEKKPYEKEEK